MEILDFLQYIPLISVLMVSTKSLVIVQYEQMALAKD